MAGTKAQSRQELVASLQEQVRQVEGSHRPTADHVSSGIEALDALLPAGGFRRGTLVEWLAAGGGSGASALALMTAREICRGQGALVVVDRQRLFYPPAAAALGIDLATTIVVCPANEKDHSWALDQILNCTGVAATLCWPEKLAGKAFRRLQLAAERGGGLGLLVRPHAVRSQPSWAEVRLLIEPRPSEAGRKLRVELLRCRGGTGGAAVELELNEETGMIHETSPLHLASELAHPKTRSGASRA